MWHRAKSPSSPLCAAHVFASPAARRRTRFRVAFTCFAPLSLTVVSAQRARTAPSARVHSVRNCAERARICSPVRLVGAPLVAWFGPACAPSDSAVLRRLAGSHEPQCTTVSAHSPAGKSGANKTTTTTKAVVHSNRWLWLALGFIICVAKRNKLDRQTPQSDGPLEPASKRDQPAIRAGWGLLNCPCPAQVSPGNKARKQLRPTGLVRATLPGCVLGRSSARLRSGAKWPRCANSSS